MNPLSLFCCEHFALYEKRYPVGSGIILTLNYRNPDNRFLEVKTLYRQYIEWVFLCQELGGEFYGI